MESKVGSLEKEPLSDAEYDRILEIATRMSDEARKIVLILRWTGMHVSVLAEPTKYDLHMETEEGADYFVWKRTKKKEGKEAYTDIQVHSSIDSKEMKAFISELRRRRKARKKRKISRQYFYGIIKKIGLRANLPELSPMSFRHTLGVWMLNQGYPEKFVQQKLNCSDRILKTYLKYSRKVSKPLYDRFGW